MTATESASLAPDQVVLVVEDNPRNMKLITMLLKSKRFTVLQAEDGESGLQRLATAKVDLMVLDIQLPGISGLEVAQAVRRNPEHNLTPILAVTAFAMSADREAALRAGCSAYLTKPLDLPAFFAALEQLMGATIATV